MDLSIETNEEKNLRRYNSRRSWIYSEGVLTPKSPVTPSFNNKRNSINGLIFKPEIKRNSNDGKSIASNNNQKNFTNSEENSLKYMKKIINREVLINLLEEKGLKHLFNPNCSIQKKWMEEPYEIEDLIEKLKTGVIEEDDFDCYK
jgi:hypothetical protein